MFFLSMQLRTEPLPVLDDSPVCARAFQSSPGPRTTRAYHARLPFDRVELRQIMHCLRDNHWVSQGIAKVIAGSQAWPVEQSSIYCWSGQRHCWRDWIYGWVLGLITDPPLPLLYFFLLINMSFNLFCYRHHYQIVELGGVCTLRSRRGRGNGGW